MTKVRLKNIKPRRFACQLTSRPLPSLVVRFVSVEREIPQYESFELDPHEEKEIDAALLDEPAISGALLDGWLRNMGEVAEVHAQSTEESAEDDAVTEAQEHMPQPDESAA